MFYDVLRDRQAPETLQYKRQMNLSKIFSNISRLCCVDEIRLSWKMSPLSAAVFLCAVVFCAAITQDEIDELKAKCRTDIIDTNPR